MTLGSAAAGEAGSTLATPLFFVTNNDSVRCKAVNVGTSTRTVRMLLLDIEGVVHEDSGEVTLAPGKGAFSEANSDNEHFYCKFIGSSSSIRASLNVRDEFGIDRVVVPAQ